MTLMFSDTMQTGGVVVNTSFIALIGGVEGMLDWIFGDDFDPTM